MSRALKWALAALGITVASVAVFILAAALFPGNPARFYLVVCTVLLTITLAWRALGLPVE